MVVAARMVYRGAPLFDDNGIAPVNKLQNWSRLFKTINKTVTHPLVVVVWTELPFPGVQSFPNNIFAVIGAFDVVRIREELVLNVPWMPKPEVRISMFVALTDWTRAVSTQSDASGSSLAYLSGHWHA